LSGICLQLTNNAFSCDSAILCSSVCNSKPDTCNAYSIVNKTCRTGKLAEEIVEAASGYGSESNFYTSVPVKLGKYCSRCIEGVCVISIYFVFDAYSCNYWSFRRRALLGGDNKRWRNRRTETEQKPATTRLF
jgi:hypothetical protein